MLARRLPKLLFICAGALGLLYLAALTTLALAQRSFLYFPAGIVEAPAIKGAQVLHLDTADGERLLAWYVPPAAGKPLPLFFHGNGGNLATVEDMLADLARPGNGVLAVEYRGYPGSTGAPSETGLIADAEAAYAKALALGIQPERIMAVGQSLGSGVAVALAARHPLAGLVLDSPFTSAQAVAERFYWMFPVSWVMLDPFHSDRRIGKNTAPLLIVHGTADPVIPYAFGQALYGMANARRTFVTVEGGGHLSLGTAMPQVLAWIKEKRESS